MQLRVSERSRAHLKPRFPRLSLMHRRRKDDAAFYDADLRDPTRRTIPWFCTADEEGMIVVRTR